VLWDTNYYNTARYAFLLISSSCILFSWYFCIFLGDWYCARCSPDGLPPHHVGCVLCSEEEKKSFDWIDKLSRRVQHFGFEFSYDTKNVDSSKSLGLLPPLFSPLTSRMEKWFLENQTPFFRKAAEWDQLTINEYMPGQGTTLPPSRCYTLSQHLVSLNDNNKQLQASHPTSIHILRLRTGFAR